MYAQFCKLDKYIEPTHTHIHCFPCLEEARNCESKISVTKWEDCVERAKFRNKHFFSSSKFKQIIKYEMSYVCDYKCNFDRRLGMRTRVTWSCWLLANTLHTYCATWSLELWRLKTHWNAVWRSFFGVFVSWNSKELLCLCLKIFLLIWSIWAKKKWNKLLCIEGPELLNRDEGFRLNLLWYNRLFWSNIYRIMLYLVYRVWDNFERLSN